MPPQELVEDDEEDIDEAELNLDKVEEEMAADYSDEEEDEILHIDEFSAIMNAGGNGTNSGGGIGTWPTGSTLPQRPEEILQSNTDSEAWNLEVERVAPQLKVHNIFLQLLLLRRLIIWINESFFEQNSQVSLYFNVSYFR